MKPLRCALLAGTFLLAACSQPTKSAQQAELQGKKWVLLIVDRMPAVPGAESFVDGFRNLTLSFQADDFSGYDGCNTFGGSYEATATTLVTAELGGSTRECEAEISARAKTYLDALERVATYRITEDEQLELQNGEGRTVLTFAEADDRYQVALQLGADAGAEFDDRSRVRVRVWGFDRNIADASATNLKDQVFDLPSLEVKPSVSFTEQHLLQVYPFSGSEEGLGYYLTFAIDADGDDRICPGDYRQHYDQTDPLFFTKEDVGTRNVDVTIEKITEQRECEAF